jgi:hypothetical protein
MGFALFILVNATLFLRPGEIVPELLGLPIYEFLIVSCFFLSLSDIFKYFLSGPVDAKPITFCVFGLLAAIVVSKLVAHDTGESAFGGRLEETWDMAFYFSKVIVYYVLLVSIVNTPQRLRTFVFWLAVFTATMAAVGVLQYFDYIHLPTLKVLTDMELDPTTGRDIKFARLQGSGAFQDPNEFCLILAVMVPLCLYQLSRSRSGFLRFFWLGPLALFLYAIYLTHSRGGFLALLGGLGILAWARWGTRRTLLLGLLGLPVLVLGLGGRQTTLSTSSGTGQTRIQIWSDWFMDFRGAPLLGKGMRVKKEQPEETAKKKLAGEEDKFVAHNSYLHAFTELGVVGGTLFLGVFCLAVVGVLRLGRRHVLDPEQRRLQPFVLGTVVAFVTGMLSLSLCYVNVTYLILGLAEIQARVTPTYPPLSPLRLNSKVAGWIMLASIVFLLALYVFIRLTIRWT